MRSRSTTVSVCSGSRRRISTPGSTRTPPRAGLMIASNVLDAIDRDGQPAADRWVAALRAGASVPPLELARIAGVDMEQPEPLQHAMASFGSLVTQLDDAFA